MGTDIRWRQREVKARERREKRKDGSIGKLRYEVTQDCIFSGGRGLGEGWERGGGVVGEGVGGDSSILN